MNILLCVTGSISAYKAIELSRSLVKNGHQVKVITSRGALEFINPQIFRYLGVIETYCAGDDFSQDKYRELNGNVLHIELAKWCDVFCVYPLSANTLSRFVHAQCDDLMSSIFLALDSSKKKIFFPAMNTKMLEHPFVEENLKKLGTLASTFIHPTQTGVLACGDDGLGKLAPIEEATDIIECFHPTQQKRALITTGATMAPLDSVRYLTNPSSGKTGYELAKALLSKGFEVSVIATFSSTPLLQNLMNLPSFKLKTAKTTSEMMDLVSQEFDSCDYYISSAAIGDIEFNYQSQKLKKESIENHLSVKKSVDILAHMLQKKTKQKIIGFAAESGNDTHIFSEKLKRKPVDLLVGNFVSNGVDSKLQGFSQNENEYFFISNTEIIPQGLLSKKNLANKLVCWIEASSYEH